MRATIPDEVRYTPEGYELRLGQTVWTRKLFWCSTRGTLVREKYGVYSGLEGESSQVKLRHARRFWRCSDCGQSIEKGAMHGSTFYDHYCLECVTPIRPETKFREG